jgi:hypothetical protein
VGIYDGQDLGEALDTLIREMHDARDAYDANEQHGGLLALRIVTGFVDYLAKQPAPSGQPIRHDLADPLVRISGAIQSTLDGERDPFLKPDPAATRVELDGVEDKVGGRKSAVPFSELQGRAAAAAAVGLCRLAGLSLPNVPRANCRSKTRFSGVRRVQ